MLCTFHHSAVTVPAEADGGGSGGDGDGSEFRGDADGEWLPSTLAERVPSVASPMSYEIFCPYPGAPRCPICTCRGAQVSSSNTPTL